MSAPAPIRARLLKVGAAIAIALVLIIVGLRLVVPAEYSESQTIELSTFEGGSASQPVCIRAPATVSFTWVVGSVLHNGTSVAYLPPFIANLVIWPAGSSSSHAVYNETGSSGSGSYSAQGSVVFEALGMNSNEAAWVYLSWQAPGHILGGPTSSANC